MFANNDKYIKNIKKIIIEDFSSLKNKTIFITGSSGLIGSFLIDTLMFMNRNLNYNIKIFATFTTEKSYKTRFPSYNKENLFNPVIQDINSPINTDIKPDYIIHAASNTHPLLYASKPVETIKLNINGLINILDFALKFPKSKTLFLSTLEVYGENSSIESFKENEIGNLNFMISRSCYPESKRLCETLCHSYIKEFNQNIVIARLGYIYGSTVKLDSSKADVQFLNNALCGENIMLKSSGMQKRSYCYVADTVSALLTILLKGENGEVYNVASENGNVYLKDFAYILAEISGVKVEFGTEGKIEKEGGSKIINSTLNSQKLISLGWQAKFSFYEGIKNTFDICSEVKAKC